MKLAPQPVRRNLGAKPAPPNLSVSAHRSRAKLGAVNPFRINTCESVSKQSTLSIFRINTYEKHRGRGVLLLTRIRQTSQATKPARVSRGPTPTESCQLTADSAFRRLLGAIR